MRITLDYRNPTPSHCGVAIFVNGALAGTLTLRQDEIVSFQQILAAGCQTFGDKLGPNTGRIEAKVTEGDVIIDKNLVRDYGVEGER